MKREKNRKQQESVEVQRPINEVKEKEIVLPSPENETLETENDNGGNTIIQQQAENVDSKDIERRDLGEKSELLEKIESILIEGEWRKVYDTYKDNDSYRAFLLRIKKMGELLATKIELLLNNTKPFNRTELEKEIKDFLFHIPHAKGDKDSIQSFNDFVKQEANIKTDEILLLQQAKVDNAIKLAA